MKKISKGLITTPSALWGKINKKTGSREFVKYVSYILLASHPVSLIEGNVSIPLCTSVSNKEVSTNSNSRNKWNSLPE